MCFEYRPQTADYDMNDVVLRTTRLGEDKIQLSIIACGAYDAIVLGGIQGGEEKGFNGKEVHELFGYEYGKKIFINTEKNAAYIEPVTEIVTVEKNLSMDDFLKSIYIENRTMGKTVKMPERGEAPNAIILSINFRYPLERKSITDAYPDFLTWAVNMNVNKDRYLYWEEDFVLSRQVQQAMINLNWWLNRSNKDVFAHPYYFILLLQRSLSRLIPA